MYYTHYLPVDEYDESYYKYAQFRTKSPSRSPNYEDGSYLLEKRTYGTRKRSDLQFDDRFLYGQAREDLHNEKVRKIGEFYLTSRIYPEDLNSFLANKNKVFHFYLIIKFKFFFIHFVIDHQKRVVCFEFKKRFLYLICFHCFFFKK